MTHKEVYGQFAEMVSAYLETAEYKNNKWKTTFTRKIDHKIYTNNLNDIIYRFRRIDYDHKGILRYSQASLSDRNKYQPKFDISTGEERVSYLFDYYNRED